MVDDTMNTSQSVMASPVGSPISRPNQKTPLLKYDTVYWDSRQSLPYILDMPPEVKKPRAAASIECHGISNLLSTKNTLKRVGWALFLLCILAGLLYEIGKTGYDYYSKPILTTVSLQLEDSMPFPKLYICPLNFINFTFIKENKWLPLLPRAKMLQKSFAVGEDNSLLKGVMTTWQSLWPSITVDSKLRGSTLPYMTDQEFYMKIGYQTDQFFRDCFFENQQFKCSDYVTAILDKDFGKCFLLSLPNDWRQRTAGLGLNVVLDINTDLYPPLSYKTLSPPMYDGVAFGVHHEFDPAGLPRFRVGPGQHAQFGMDISRMQLINVEKYTKQKQRCLNEEEGTRKMKMLSAKYSVESCKMDCFQQVVFRVCQCFMLMDERFIKPQFLQAMKHSRQKKLLFCDKVQMRCVDSKVIKDAEEMKLVRACTQSCFQACEHWKYTLVGSSTPFPSSHLLTNDTITGIYDDTQQGKNLSTPQKWKKDFVILSLAFNELEITEISQSKSMTIDTFIANLGGHMGIWLGASLVTIVQAVFFAIESCYRIKKKPNFPEGQRLSEDGGMAKSGTADGISPKDTTSSGDLTRAGQLKNYLKQKHRTLSMPVLDKFQIRAKSPITPERATDNV